MKVKLLQYFQGAETQERQLAPGEVHDLPDALALFLVENKKAELVVDEPEDEQPADEPAEKPAPKRRKARK